MVLLPLERPLDGRALLKKTYAIYTHSLLGVLPWSMAIVAIYFMMRHGKRVLPPFLHAPFTQIAMFLAVLTIPLFCGIILLADTKAKKHRLPLSALLSKLFYSFLRIVGAFASVILLPAILLGGCLLIYYALWVYHAPMILVWLWKITTYLILLAALVPKLFTFFFILIDNQETNDALEHSERITYPYYWRTFFHILFNILGFVLLSSLFLLLQHFLPSDHGTLWRNGLFFLLGVFGIPWFIAALLTHKYDLVLRSQHTNNKERGLPVNPKTR